MAFFYLETVTTFTRTIECDTREQANAAAVNTTREANGHNRPGEVTTVRVLRFADHLQTCDACGCTQEPCGVGKRMIESEG